MTIFQKIIDIFEASDVAPPVSAEHLAERDAGDTFNHYYRSHLARFDPGFLASIKGGSGYVEVIDAMSARYGVLVPAHSRIDQDIAIYQRIQAAMLAIEQVHA